MRMDGADTAQVVVRSALGDGRGGHGAEQLSTRMSARQRLSHCFPEALGLTMRATSATSPLRWFVNSDTNAPMSTNPVSPSPSVEKTTVAASIVGWSSSSATASTRATASASLLVSDIFRVLLLLFFSPSFLLLPIRARWTPRKRRAKARAKRRTHRQRTERHSHREKEKEQERKRDAGKSEGTREEDAGLAQSPSGCGRSCSCFLTGIPPAKSTDRLAARRCVEWHRRLRAFTDAFPSKTRVLCGAVPSGIHTEPARGERPEKSQK